MVRTARGHLVHGSAATGAGAQFLELGLLVELVHRVGGLGHPRHHQPLDHAVRSLGAAVEVHRAEHRLEGIGQDRRLVGAAGSSLTASEQDVRPEIEVLGDLGQRDRVDHALAQVGQLALGHVVAVVHHVGDRPAEHGVAEELQPLVADRTGGLGTPRTMGERTTQQGLVGEPMADAIGQRCEIRVGSGRHHVDVRST